MFVKAKTAVGAYDVPGDERAILAACAAFVAGCGADAPAPREGSSGPGAAPAAAVIAEAERRCKAVQDASRAGPRFPFRTFDPSNPDGRLRRVGRFYTRLDTEGTLEGLETDLKRIAPGGELDALVTDIARLEQATRAQTRAAVSGDRDRMIVATAHLEEVADAQHETAADLGAFACALSLERNPKTLR